MTQGKLKKWITDTLKNDTEYQALCISVVGEELNYYRSPPMNKVVEDLPFLATYSNDYEEDDQSQALWNETWEIPIAIAMQSVDKYVMDEDVETWESTDKIEEIAITARDILKRESFGCGIKGESINLIATSLSISEVGEADDVQASMFLTFGKLNSI